MDETGLQLEHKPQRVIAQKGVRYLHARTSENREMLTVIACVNAAGDRIPPHIIAKKRKERCMVLMCKVHHKAQPGMCKAQAGQNKESHVSGSKSPF